MAELVVSPLIELVIEKVTDGLSAELGLLQGVEKDMRKLQSILSTIRDVLDDAEKRSFSDKSVRGWLNKLKDAAYDADDVVDMFQTEVQRQQVENRDSAIKQVKDFLSSRNPFLFSRKIAHKIKEVLERLDDIAAEREKFHLKPGSASTRSAHRETTSLVIESEVLGRGDVKEKIINFLINEEIDKDLSVLPIVGLGGIGKTTLAQLVYNDDKTKLFFDLRIWICVSDDFDVKEITRKIIECIKNQKYDNLELESLSNLLREKIEGKRFFLVLDDVWNKDHEKWERLRSLLRYGIHGSKIVITTRSEVVANVMGTTSPYRLKGFSFDDCWNLFRQRAFGLGKEQESPKLTKIGKEIVQKCGGLPLAAKALGSLMGSKRGEHEWLAIRDSEIWKLTDEDRILPALNLSYHHLPAHLKRCFVYCSLFPKDYEFNKKELIRLWIGEGFVASTDEDTSLEDVGNQYFNGLLLRSFFEDITKDIYGDDIETCKMHDLMHDLACKVGKNEFNLTTYRKEIEHRDKYRYLSLIMDDKSPQILDLNCETMKLRSLNFIQDWWSSSRIKEVNSDVFVKLRNLRVLCLSGCDISILPSKICRLKHLRFLDLSHSSIKILPASIGCLYNLSTLILSSCVSLKKLPSTITRLHNLYTLDVSYCSKLIKLPFDISKMKNLRHLDNHRCDKLSGMPTGMGQLANLKTLSLFIVGEGEEQHITELQQLNQIGGHLTIKNLQKVTNPVKARDANLRGKTHVKHLKLEWADKRKEANVSEEELLEYLVPPPNVKHLELSNYLGISYPSWLQSSDHLMYIKLRDLQRLESLPPLGQLPFLKHLLLIKLPAIRRLGEEFYGYTYTGGYRPFPFESLEVLELSYMYNLDEWVVGAGDRERDMMFRCLTKLEIRECPKLTRVEPGLPVSVVNLNITGEVVLAAESLSGMNKVRKLRIWNSKAASTSSSSSSSSSSFSFWCEGLHYLTVLERLEFWHCSEMIYLLEGVIRHHIPTLRTLSINWCTALMSLVETGNGNENGDQGMCRIDFTPPSDYKEMCIVCRQPLPPFPPPLLFTSLRQLIIKGCVELTALPEWVGSLPFLQLLQIKFCNRLKMLPDGLPNLQRLSIEYCSILERRYMMETGEDWNKVAHIPHILFTSTTGKTETRRG